MDIEWSDHARARAEERKIDRGFLERRLPSTYRQVPIGQDIRLLGKWGGAVLVRIPNGWKVITVLSRPEEKKPAGRKKVVNREKRIPGWSKSAQGVHSRDKGVHTQGNNSEAQNRPKEAQNQPDRGRDKAKTKQELSSRWRNKRG